jgi:hypothetical protein
VHHLDGITPTNKQREKKHIENETKFAHKLPTVQFVAKATIRAYRKTHTISFSRHTSPSNVADRTMGVSVTFCVPSGLRPLQGRRQCAVWHSLQHTSPVVTAACSLATRSRIILGGTALTCSFRCPHRKKSIRLRSVF